MLDRDYILEKNKGRCTLKYIKCHYPIDYENIIRLNGSSFSEKLYKYLYPNSTGLCKICGQPTRFLNIRDGYRTYCSTQCSYKDPDRIEHMKYTNKTLYGSEWPQFPQEYRTNPEKTKQTKLERYGNEVFNNRDKMKETSIIKYGEENVMKIDTFK